MKIPGVVTQIVWVLGVLIASVQLVRASEVLYDNSGFVEGQQSFEQSFAIGGPGVLTVTLTNMSWPETLASLNLVVSTTQGLLGPEMGAGTATFKLEGGSVFAQWFGAAQGPLDVGVYGVKIDFAPTSVPLPTSIALLLSGLMLLAWQRRGFSRHATSS